MLLFLYSCHYQGNDFSLSHLSFTLHNPQKLIGLWPLPQLWAAPHLAYSHYHPAACPSVIAPPGPKAVTRALVWTQLVPRLAVTGALAGCHWGPRAWLLAGWGLTGQFGRSSQISSVLCPWGLQHSSLQLRQTVMQSTALLHCTALSCTALHCTALPCTALHSTAVQCSALHCTALHCTAILFLV